MKRPVHADGAPAAAGPYSHAVVAGEFVYLSGQGPVDPATGEQPASFEDQARQAFRNLAAVAEAADASLADAVRVGVFLRDMGDFALMNEVYKEFIGEPFPARTTIQSDIPIPIEIDAVLYTG
jgi:2-iminobutanoate/2-iminopropanoate deaminase